MKIIDRIPFSHLNQLQVSDKTYQTHAETFSDFYRWHPNYESFGDIIQNKQFPQEKRDLLCKVLVGQYTKLNLQDRFVQIQKLKQSNCFTLVSAHQPCLMGGPLYVFIKIANTIHLCNRLKKDFPSFEFIPVYWMGSEDHDIDELNHVWIQGNKIQWNQDQNNAIGRYNTAGLAEIIDILQQHLGQQKSAEELIGFLKDCLTKSVDIQSFYHHFFDFLFGAEGLIVVNGDHYELKKSFSSVMKQDLFEQRSFHLVKQQISKLQNLGFKNQANPREINLFYFSEQGRNRIIFENKVYKIVDTEIQFTAEELEKELDSHPERFSPNVILRPLYQEFLLPNLAFIGGGAEISYWLERKNQFEYFHIDFPMLIRRNSIMIVETHHIEKISQLGLRWEDLFLPYDALCKKWLKTHENEYDFSAIEQAIGNLETLFTEKAVEVDTTLIASSKAFANQVRQLSDKLSQKITKALKNKHEVQCLKIHKIQIQLNLPDQLQERKNGFLYYRSLYGAKWTKEMIDLLDPFQKDFLLIQNSEI